MPYSYLTYAQLRAQLAARLGDSGNVFWLDAELGLYVKEALRTWQSMTMFWRDRMEFTLAQNTQWYDLTAQTGSLLSYNVKDSDLASVMLYQLIEPQLSLMGAYVGTDMFTLADFTNALQRRRDQFLLETVMVTGRSVVNGPTPPESRIVLADSIIDVKRASWIAPGAPSLYGVGLYGVGLYGSGTPPASQSTLWKTDEWGAQAFTRGWSSSPQNPPINFSVAAVPPVELAVIPPPLAGGQIELITVSAGTPLNPSSGVLLGVPDDFSWVVKMGALADLLNREGQSKDAQRGQYCQARWEEGIALAKMYNSVVVAYLDGTQVFPQSIRAFSAYRSGWQNETLGSPDALGVMSWNLVAVAPKPDAHPHSAMLDVVRNCPVPVNDTDQIQIGREELDVILDYAEHLAAFKEGGDEFMATLPLYQNVVNLAKKRNLKIREDVPFFAPLSDRSTRQEAATTVGEEITT